MYGMKCIQVHACFPDLQFAAEEAARRAQKAAEEEKKRAAEKAERAARAAAYQEADWIKASEEAVEVRSFSLAYLTISPLCMLSLATHSHTSQKHLQPSKTHEGMEAW